PIRPLRLGPRDVEVERRADGTIRLRSPHPLPPYPAKLTERLEFWAARAPQRTFLAQREARGDGRRLRHGGPLEQARRIAQALIARSLSAERPVVILSGNGIAHAVVGLAATYAGVPYAPVSPAYSLVSSDFGKLRSILDLLTPGL